MASSKKPIKTHFFIFFKIPLQPTHYFSFFSFSDRQPNSPSTTCGGLRRSLPPLPSRSEMGSNAALRVVSYLPFPYSTLSGFRIFPTTIRDSMYDYVAKRRYEWFGKENDCLLLGEKEMLERFIDRDEILEIGSSFDALAMTIFSNSSIRTADASFRNNSSRILQDPGLVKARSYDPKQGLESLTVVPISKARALQRRDRARKPGSNNSPIPWEGNSRIGGYRHRPNKALLICLRD
ncbi:hypothetical protein CsatB_019721 [Cannabis sativa]